MSAKKQRVIRRGVVLSDSGFERVQRAHRRLELDENNGARISLEELAHRVRLSTKTLSRLFSRDVPVDRRTIELLFAELHLRLGPEDVRSPSARARSDRFHFPQYLTTLFGREKELTRLTELAAEHQVITLAGTGGIGKTRLAVEWARRIGGVYSHFAFLDTSVFTDGATLREAVSLILMESALDGEPHLLVLDGCEHLIEAAAGSVRELLDAQPTFTVLATSREPLRVPGEMVIRLATLAVPEQTAEAPAAIALASPAFAMFIERARSFDDDFALPEASVPIVVEIVRRLEGLPLALELAAARGTHMTLQDLLASLDDHLATLSEDGRQTIPRHRSARALIDWGFALLTAQERIVFACLAAFMGSFDAAAVATVCEISKHAAADTLSNLVRKSLLFIDVTGPLTRFRMLETIRQYAATKLAESPLEGPIRLRHALFYLGVAEVAARAFGTVNQEAATRDLHRELPNLREALQWTSSKSYNLHLSAALTAQLIDFWEVRGAFVEAEHWLRRALEAQDDMMTAAVRGRLSEGLALALYRRGHLSECMKQARSALTDYDRCENESARLRVLNLFGVARMDAGETDSAREQFEENLRAAESGNDVVAKSAATNNLGRILAEHDNRLEEAVPYFTRALEEARTCGSVPQVMHVLGNLSSTMFRLNRHVAGLTYARLGSGEAEKNGNAEAAIDFALQAVGHQLGESGLDAAREDAHIALRLVANATYRPSVADHLDSVCIALHLAGGTRRAAVILGAADAFRRRGDAQVTKVSSERQRVLRNGIAEVLKPGEGEALYARGAAMSLGDAFRDALIDDYV